MKPRLSPPTDEPFVVNDGPETLDSLWVRAEQRGRVSIENWGSEYTVSIHFETSGGSRITAVGRNDQLGLEALKQAMTDAINEADRIVNRYSAT